jgi:hypothetical protein
MTHLGHFVPSWWVKASGRRAAAGSLAILRIVFDFVSECFPALD